jgi:Tol biopolymer transport system component
VRGTRTAAAILVSSLAALLVAASAQAAFPGDNGRIVFTEFFFLGGLQGGLNTVEPDGTGEDFIVPDAGMPAFSADGKTLVYACDSRLCRADPDGKDRHKFVQVGERQRWPGFDRSGRRLVFVADSGSLMVARANGRRARRVRGAGHAWQPEFFNTGDRIVFSKKVGKSREIYSIRRDGSDLTRITKAPKRTVDVNPSVSPDGKRIAFERHRSKGATTARVLTVRPNGKGEKELLDNAGTPAYSPDGQRIAFQSIDRGFRYVGVANADGSDRADITENDAATLPAWQPLP